MKNGTGGDVAAVLFRDLGGGDELDGLLEAEVDFMAKNLGVKELVHVFLLVRAGDFLVVEAFPNFLDFLGHEGSLLLAVSALPDVVDEQVQSFYI